MMKRFLPLALSVAFATVLAVAPSAAAKPCNDQTTVPPGQSEVDQYSETVPGECGNENVPSPDGDEDPAASIPPGTLADLEELGPDGRAAALLAAAGGRGGDKGGGGSGAGGDEAGAGVLDDTLGGPASVTLPDDEGSFFDSVVDALSGEGGLGIIVPIALALICVLAVTAIVRSSRTTT